MIRQIVFSEIRGSYQFVKLYLSVELSLWNKAKMAVSVLPNEILSQIFGLLNPIDFGKILMTCNKWRKIAMIPDVFLKQKEKLKRLRKFNVHIQRFARLLTKIQ